MLRLYFAMAIAMFFAVACNQNPQSTDGKTANAELSKPDTKVTVYYFHGRQRCPGCVAVQEISKKAYDGFFADNQDVRFMEVDFSRRENYDLAEKYEVVFSSLIIATEDGFLDLTQDAFAYANTNPAELEKLIVSETENLLKL